MKEIEYSDFLPIWKEYIGETKSVLNVQMVAHHFYNLGLQASPQMMPLSDEEILNIAFCSEIDTVAIENDWNGTVLQFAREILKKASEK